MKAIKEQFIPLLLTIITFFGLCSFLYLFIQILNRFPSRATVSFQLRWEDIIIGLIIYIKTSIDFAIFIGNLMHSNPGWKNRIAIELGTAFGNAAGTVIILAIWNFFREIPVLMVFMIILASLVLLKMAEESFEEYIEINGTNPLILQMVKTGNSILHRINTIFSPFLNKLIPNMSMTNGRSRNFFTLLIFAISIPLILGLDDFAGYIPLFSIVNVFGFSVGVFLGHMLLNLGLFVSPAKTTTLVKNKIMLIFGSMAFVGIALWGFYEALHLVLRMV